MIVTFSRRFSGNPLDCVQGAVRAISAAEYGGNIRAEITWSKGRRVRFVLRANNSRAYGARKSASGRHTVAVSWEAHRDIMSAIFLADPEARIQTALAVYHGETDFRVKYPETADKNIGSQYNPMTMPECSIKRPANLRPLNPPFTLEEIKGGENA